MFALKFSLSALLHEQVISVISHVFRKGIIMRGLVFIFERQHVFCFNSLKCYPCPWKHTRISTAALGLRLCGVRSPGKLCDMTRQHGNVVMPFLPSVASVTLCVGRAEVRQSQKLSALVLEMGTSFVLEVGSY